MTAIPECPAHSGPGGWYDHGCRGCVAARLAQTERSLSAMNAENLRLTAALSQARDRAVELDFAAERALDMLQSGRHYDAEATLETVLGNGSESAG